MSSVLTLRRRRGFKELQAFSTSVSFPTVSGPGGAVQGKRVR